MAVTPNNKIERAWDIVNIVAFLALILWSLTLDQAAREAPVSGWLAVSCATFIFSIGGLFIYSGRIPKRYTSGFIARSDSPYAFWFIVTVFFLLGLRLLLLW